MAGGYLLPGMARVGVEKRDFLVGVLGVRGVRGVLGAAVDSRARVPAFEKVFSMTAVCNV